MVEGECCLLGCEKSTLYTRSLVAKCRITRSVCELLVWKCRGVILQEVDTVAFVIEITRHVRKAIVQNNDVNLYPNLRFGFNEEETHKVAAKTHTLTARGSRSVKSVNR